MSTFRRALMANILSIDNEQYIEGYCRQINGAYPETYSLIVNGGTDYYKLIKVNVDSNSGFWRWNIGKEKIYTLYRMFYINQNSTQISESSIKSVKLHINNLYVDINDIFRRSKIEDIDMSCMQSYGCGISRASSFDFGGNSPDINTYGFTSLLKSIDLPNWTADSSNSFSNCKMLSNIRSAGIITNNISFSVSPLTIASAKVVLNALQQVEGKTLTFSSTTKQYINADSEALQLVAEKRLQGWTIAL